MTKQYTQTNSLYMYRRSLNIIEEAVREVIPCVKKSVNKSFIRVKILKKLYTPIKFTVTHNAGFQFFLFLRYFILKMYKSHAVFIFSAYIYLEFQADEIDLKS